MDYSNNFFNYSSYFYNYYNLSNDIFINNCLKVIDNKNKNEINILIEKYNIYNINEENNDIAFEMYNRNQLNSERLQFIIENCMDYLKISSKLMEKLMENDQKKLLDIIFKNLLNQCLKDIDNKNKKEIKILFKQKYNINNIEKYIDIVYEIYNRNQLNSERLQFIIDNCTSYLKISSKLMEKLMKNDQKELLEIIFINQFLNAIDNKNIEEIKILFNEYSGNDTKNYDIVFELYNRNQLNSERFQFIIENCTDFLEISSRLIENLIKNNKKELLDIFYFYFEYQSCKAIDNKNKKEIEILFKKYNLCNIKEYDIILEIYKHKLLYFERLQFIIENCTDYITISSNLIKELMKNEEISLLEIIFKKYLKFFDNEAIINLLTLYKNKTAISDLALHQLVDNDKYKFSECKKPYYFHNVCKSGNELIVRYLVKLGANINKENIVGETPLFEACSSGNEHLVKYLIKLGADINKENNNGKTPLFNACSSGNELLVKYLVELGLNINKETTYGETPLFDASRNGNEDVVKYLVELGANVNKVNNEGKTPLCGACWNSREKIVKYLLEHGADADVNKEDEEGQTLLFNASKYGKENIMKYLVEHGADVNKKDIYGKTPLCYAYNNRVIEYLVEHGADINKYNNKVVIPQYNACKSKNNFIEYLINLEEDINNETTSEFNIVIPSISQIEAILKFKG